MGKKKKSPLARLQGQFAGRIDENVIQLVLEDAAGDLDKANGILSEMIVQQEPVQVSEGNTPERGEPSIDSADADSKISFLCGMFEDYTVDDLRFSLSQSQGDLEECVHGLLGCDEDFETVGTPPTPAPPPADSPFCDKLTVLHELLPSHSRAFLAEQLEGHGDDLEATINALLEAANASCDGSSGSASSASSSTANSFTVDLELPAATCAVGLEHQRVCEAPARYRSWADAVKENPEPTTSTANAHILATLCADLAFAEPDLIESVFAGCNGNIDETVASVYDIYFSSADLEEYDARAKAQDGAISAAPVSLQKRSDQTGLSMEESEAHTSASTIVSPSKSTTAPNQATPSVPTVASAVSSKHSARVWRELPRKQVKQVEYISPQDRPQKPVPTKSTLLEGPLPPPPVGDQSWSKEALRLARLRASLFRQAASQYASGNGAAASSLSRYGREVQHELRQCQRNAFLELFWKHNSTANVGRGGVVKVDLHGLFVQEAEDVLEEIISHYQADMINQAAPSSPVYLHVITGVGKHSVGGRPKLLPAIKRLLSEKGYRPVENHGALVVRLR